MAKVLIGNFKGPKGDKGDKGDPGTAATIQVGTTQTVQPEANAEVTNTGTANAAVLDFKIPRGEDGMTDLTAEYKDDSSYTCQPTVNAPVVVKGVDGKTEQVETTGAQLLDMENYDFATTRCTISKSSDYIIFTATAADAYFGDVVRPGSVTSQEVLPVSPNTEYTATISNNYFARNYISFLDSNKTGIQKYLEFTSQSQSFTTPDNCAYILLRFGKANSANGDTERLQIMLNKGSAALPWEPYTGGQPAPSPDYPQVIKGVGGMGCFDGEWVQGNISSTGAIGMETTGITSANAIPCKQNDNIAVTYEDSIDVIAVAFYNASGVYISTSTSGNNVDTFTATAPANAASFKVNLRVVSGSTITPNGAKYCTVTINGEYQTGVESNSAQLGDWDVYINEYADFDNKTGTLKQKSEAGNTIKSSVKIQIVSNKVAVKQLFSSDEIGTKQYTTIYDGSYDEIRVGFNGNAQDSLVKMSTKPLKKGETYTISFNFESNNINAGVISGIMINKGSEPLPFQPYHHTTLTIPLTSPLYEGDKICYVKPGESYVDENGDTVVADRMLYGHYHENGRVILDGSEDENIMAITSQSGRFQIDVGNTKFMLNNCFCNLLQNKDTESVENDNSFNTGTKLFIRINKFGSDVEALKTWLQSNNLEVVYKLAQPYFEPFVDQSIFYTLRTDDTLSYVYSNDPIEPVLTVEVAKNGTGGYLLESYAQAQKNAISEANSQSRLSAIEQQLVNQATTPTE